MHAGVKRMMIVSAQLSADLAASAGAPRAVLAGEVRGIDCAVLATAAATNLSPLPAGDTRVLLLTTGRGEVVAASGWRARFDCASGLATVVLAPGAGAACSVVPDADSAPLALLELVIRGSVEDAAAARDGVPFALAYGDAARYTEACKSAATISRTLVPKGAVPRFAMGTVEVPGPDAVAPHVHPMLEQLFLGLPGCDAVVEADGEAAALRAWTLLHVPLGSTHGVTVDAGRHLHYVWIDVFFKSDGEAWLDGHVHQDVVGPAAGGPTVVA
jgi:hypothetical protein